MASVFYQRVGSVDRLIFHSFKPRTSDLDEDHRSRLRSLAPLMAASPGAYIDVYGACSGSGDMAFNKKVANDRMNKIYYYLKEQYPEARYNLWWVVEPQDFEKNSIFPEHPNNSSPRAVYVAVHGVQLDRMPKIPAAPPPVEEVVKPKFKHYVAPPGTWLIMAVDSFGTPALKGKIGISTVLIKLLNDKGQLYYIRGVGAAIGLGIEGDGSGVPKMLGEAGEKVFGWAKDILMKAGDLPNIITTLKTVNITGPSQTSGGIFKGGKFANYGKFSDIVSSGGFQIFSIDGHGVIAGAEMGVIVFGSPGLTSVSKINVGFYTSLGLATFKLGLGAGGAGYWITASGKLKDRVEGVDDI